MQTFCCKTEICFGSGALERLRQLSATAALIVTDRFFSENGTAAEVGRMLQGAQVAVFDGVLPDPTLSLVAQGLSRLQALAPQVVIALGGGSVIDCAKAMVYFYASALTFVAIPTTSGTGSEVTSFSILTHDGVKHPLVDPALLPDIAILDERFVQKLPQPLIADAGMDVLSHCVEAVCAKGSSPFSTALATEAFAAVSGSLAASYQGDRSVRSEVHIAAAMAGLAFDQAGLGICHALSHALGGAFHTPHGRLNAILLPAVIDFNAAVCMPRFRQLATRCALLAPTDALTVKALIRSLVQLRRALHLPASLQEAGIAPQELRSQADALAHAASLDPCCASNPRPATAEDLKSLMLSVAL